MENYFDVYNETGLNNPQKVLVLHGVFGNKSNWSTVAKKLASKYEVIVLDMPNHGLNPKKTTQATTYEFLVECIEDFIKSKLNGPVNIIGHSMGGKTAMLLAQKSPNLFKKLVVVDIAPKDIFLRETYALYEALGKIGTPKVSTKSRDEVRDIILNTCDNSRELAAYMIKSYKKLDENYYTWQFELNSIYEGFYNIAQFPKKTIDFKMNIPLLVVKGQNSSYINLPEDEKCFDEYFNSYKIEIIENTNHNPHVENTAEFIKSVFKFI